MFLVPAELGAGPGDGNFCKEHQGCAVFLARINLFALIFVPRAGYLSHFFFLMVRQRLSTLVGWLCTSLKNTDEVQQEK